MSRDLAGHGALQPALLVRKWPEPPLLAAKAMVMTEDVMMTTSSRTPLQAPAVDRMYVGNIRYMNGTDQV